MHTLLFSAEGTIINGTHTGHAVSQPVLHIGLAWVVCRSKSVSEPNICPKLNERNPAVRALSPKLTLTPTLNLILHRKTLTSPYHNYYFDEKPGCSSKRRSAGWRSRTRWSWR